MVKTNNFLGLSTVFMALCFASVEAQSQGFIDIAKGGNLICGVTTLNELTCTTNSFAQRLEPPSSIPALTQVSVGDVHGCGLDFNGQAICWGDNDYGQLDVPPNQTFESIDAGWNHTCAITSDLETLCWGLPDNNRLIAPTNGLPFIEVDANFNHTCGLEAAGGIRCWGSNNFRWDPPSSDANIETFATTTSYAAPSICALMSTGQIECNDSKYQFQGTYTDVEPWNRTMCALTTAGELECQSITDELEAEIAELNQQAPFVKLTGHHALCVVDATAQIACTTNTNNGSTGSAQRALNDVPLPNDAGVFLPPEAVNDLSARVYSESTVELFWTSSRKGGDGRVVGAEIYRNGELLTQTANSTSFLSTGLTPDIDYTYEVRLVNNRGEVGPAGNVISLNTSDSNVVNNYVRPARPATPINLYVFESTDIDVDLVWDKPASSVDVYGFEVYRDNVYLGFTQGYEYSDSRALPAFGHQYDVVAVERDGTILGFASGTTDF